MPHLPPPLPHPWQLSLLLQTWQLSEETLPRSLVDPTCVCGPSWFRADEFRGGCWNLILGRCLCLLLFSSGSFWGSTLDLKTTRNSTRTRPTYTALLSLLSQMARAPQESTIAPVKSDDPKTQKKPDEKEKTTKADGKKDDEKEAPELVCHPRNHPSVCSI